MYIKLLFIIYSKLECLHFGTWDSNKEWTIEMSEDEEIEVSISYCLAFYLK